MNAREEIVGDIQSKKKMNRKVMKQNIIRYQCPECNVSYKSTLMAAKHIQAYHTRTKSGKNAKPQLPIKIEECCICDKPFRSDEYHNCTESNNPPTFVCTACDATFNDIPTFDNHTLKIHGNGLETFYFPSSAEFIDWKTAMEQETCNKYSIQTDVNSKTYFHCNYSNININKSKVIYLCPSLILAQAFTKGIQVHFYKTHHKHCTVEYKLSSKFRKYSITNILSLSHASGIDDDLYLHFKKLMESIILDAAKINIDGLKVLTCQALEMMTVLSCYDEDHDDIPSPMPVVKKSMTDSQITEELEGIKKTNKRAAMKEPQKIKS
ncbi:unnamed protein product [Leptidea sinapis]|uniref:C2H2-type domain-containing protein n=1 Tax=Leptidea sinapis TaxID=189913 RepID=A0A5E4R814_9NEOP|nr:unnamed protein product [Leptidea sinapis]